MKIEGYEQARKTICNTAFGNAATRGATPRRPANQGNRPAGPNIPRGRGEPQSIRPLQARAATATFIAVQTLGHVANKTQQMRGSITAILNEAHVVSRSS